MNWVDNYTDEELFFMVNQLLNCINKLKINSNNREEKENIYNGLFNGIRK